VRRTEEKRCRSTALQDASRRVGHVGRPTGCAWAREPPKSVKDGWQNMTIGAAIGWEGDMIRSRLFRRRQLLFFLMVNGAAFCFDLGRPGSSDSGLVLRGRVGRDPLLGEKADG
jgi:hypothetical protein